MRYDLVCFAPPLLPPPAALAAGAGGAAALQLSGGVTLALAWREDFRNTELGSGHSTS
jgi:hypothetical protein